MAGTFFRERLWPVLFMVIITIVFISILAFLQVLTADTVKKNGTLFLKRAVLSASGVDLPADSTTIESLYAERVSLVSNSSGLAYRVAGPDSDTAVHVLVLEGPGLWGEIRLSVGLSADGSLSGISVIEQTETPGLGARIAESWFAGQFPGKRPPLSPVPEKEPAGPTEYQAVTGATITSEAVRSLLNSAPRRLADILGEAAR